MKGELKYVESRNMLKSGLPRWKFLIDENDDIIYDEYNSCNEIKFNL